jgi:hypothetical protein
MLLEIMSRGRAAKLVRDAVALELGARVGA